MKPASLRDLGQRRSSRAAARNLTQAECDKVIPPDYSRDSDAKCPQHRTPRPFAQPLLAMMKVGRGVFKYCSACAPATREESGGRRINGDIRLRSSKSKRRFGFFVCGMVARPPSHGTEMRVPPIAQPRAAREWSLKPLSEISSICVECTLSGWGAGRRRRHQTRRVMKISSPVGTSIHALRGKRVPQHVCLCGG